MDERLKKSLLYDFYGELLSEHQKEVYIASVFDDMSYSELAEEFDCSRQAAFDLVRRTTVKLENYEKKLGLLKRFVEARSKLESLTSEIEDIRASVKETDDIDKLLKEIDKKLLRVSGEAQEIFDFL
ncbi:MAG: DNA-binding protein [Eubacterium sp.]|nr:DNA-binding protein [Eubacterium sp.]